MSDKYCWAYYIHMYEPAVMFLNIHEIICRGKYVTIIIDGGCVVFYIFKPAERPNFLVYKEAVKCKGQCVIYSLIFSINFSIYSDCFETIF